MKQALPAARTALALLLPALMLPAAALAGSEADQPHRIKYKPLVRN